MELQESDKNSNKYTFTEVIGRGNYSRIWKATENHAQVSVAVKEIYKCITSAKRFYKELKYGRMLSDHTHIGTTHGLLCETESAYFVVHEFASGGDLCSWIQAHGHLEESVSKRYFHQICRAVQHMHSLNLVHMDIKPDNILLKDSQGDSVQLVDFGMTERVGKRLNSAQGTLPYMSPDTFDLHNEPMKGLKVKASFDMWSLGVVLFSMLTGSFPWMQAIMSDSDYAVFHQWQVEGSSPPPEQWSDLSSESCILLRALLTEDPNRRCKINEVFSYNFLIKP